VIDKINSLSKPETKPFEFPIPEGWRAETKNGKEVEQLTEFKGTEGFRYAGVTGRRIVTWTADGKNLNNNIDTDYDLILVREEPKTRTVWLDKSGIKNNSSEFGLWFDSIDDALGYEHLEESKLIPVTIELP
jgi:hypothetical protein